MEVFLIPVGRERYELYCEVADEDPAREAAVASTGFITGILHRFRVLLAEAERHRRAGHRTPAVQGHRSWMRRTRDRVMCWVAEKIAEQRLLWHLRRQERATAVFPADVTEAEATAVIRTALRRDADRHRRWLIIDSFGFVGSGVFFFVPGPNIVSYYFAFRLVGHYLSMRGARHGLDGVIWGTRASTPLAELRHAIALSPDQRERRVHDIASALHLEHLPTFFERTALPSA